MGSRKCGEGALWGQSQTLGSTVGLQGPRLCTAPSPKESCCSHLSHSALPYIPDPTSPPRWPSGAVAGVGGRVICWILGWGHTSFLLSVLGEVSEFRLLLSTRLQSLQSSPKPALSTSPHVELGELFPGSGDCERGGKEAWG